MKLPERVNVLGVGINATSMTDAVSNLLRLRHDGARGYVCVTSVHGVMESQRDETLRQIHNRSLLTVPDGMPTVWMGREYGFVKMGRVYGPDLMLQLCAATSGVDRCQVSVVKETSSTHQLINAATDKKCLTHFLYGSTEETLRKLKANLAKKFPGLRIVGTFAPPFRPLTEEEELQLQQVVVACKPDFFWVGLSTPKQERFMFEHDPRNLNLVKTPANLRGSLNVENGEADLNDLNEGSACFNESGVAGRLNAAIKRYPLECGILLGVGAAFDIHAGNYKDAPDWIKNSGLQWFYRLCKEPRRLWRRYLYIVPGFIWLSFLQVMGVRKWKLWDECG